MNHVLLYSIFFFACQRIAKPAITDNLLNYELVTNVETKVYDMKQIDEGGSYNDIVCEWIISTEQQELRLLLKKQTAMVSDEFSIVMDSKFDEKALNDLRDCHYHGTYANGKGKVVISDCIGIRGYLKNADNQIYFIEPITDNNTHVLYKYEDVKYDRDLLPTNYLDNMKTKDELRRMKRSTYTKLDMKYIPMVVVADHAFYAKYNYNETAVVDFIFSVVNYVNHVYHEINVQVVMTNLEIWTNEDKINVTDSAVTTLVNFHHYHSDVLIKQKGWVHHHNAHFLSGKHLTGLAGLSRSDTLCKGLSEAMTTIWHPNPYFVAGIVAHELAHNIGIKHYGRTCNCVSNHCLMSAYVSLRYMVGGFTNCSKAAFHDVCQRGDCTCMLSSPSEIYTNITNKCGNGYVEEGEECDCGPSDLCKSKCCNATTCKLVTAAQCADGTCCNKDMCTFVEAGKQCREAKDQCDFTETCSGKHKECPLDVTFADYTPCNDKKGYCYKGQCSATLEKQCQRLWGAGALPGGENCLRSDGYADEFYNCGTAKDGSYIPCDEGDAVCGKLSCYGKDLSTFSKIGTSRKTTIYTGKNATLCRLASVQVYDMADPTIAAEGTKCGNGKVCHNHKCMEETKLQKAKCFGLCENGKGVCTNQDVCHCSTRNGGSTCSRFDASNLQGKLYFPQCQNECMNGGKCNFVTEKCFCPVGTACPYCDSIDPSNTHGKQCQTEQKTEGISCGADGFKGFFSKLGCSRSITHNKTFVLLESYRDSIDWRNMNQTTQKNLCHCAEKATEGGFKTFGIQFWGECWASKKTVIEIKKFEKCFDTRYQICRPEEMMCVGNGESVYLYNIR